MKEELRSVRNKNATLKRDHIVHLKEVSHKTLDGHEMDLQEFILIGLKRTKLASIIYDVSRNRGEGIGYYQKPFNPRIETLIETSYTSSLESTQKGLHFYFVPDLNNAKALNQSEPKTLESRVLKKPESEHLQSKVLKSPEPKTLKLKVLKKPKPNASGHEVLKDS